METKHTEGNWLAKDGQVYCEETGKTLFVIPYFDKDNDKHLANQQLAAAAPDLLKALITLSEFYSNEHLFEPKEVWKQVYNAIRKANE